MAFHLNFFQQKPTLSSNFPVSLNSRNCDHGIQRISHPFISLTVHSRENCQVNSAGCFFTPKWEKNPKNVLISNSGQKPCWSLRLKARHACNAGYSAVLIFFRVNHLKYVIMTEKIQIHL